MESKRSKKGRKSRPSESEHPSNQQQEQQPHQHHPWDEGRAIQGTSGVNLQPTFASAPQISRALRIRRVGAVSHRL